MERIHARALLLAFHYTAEELARMTPSGISSRALTIAKANSLTTYAVPGRRGHWYDPNQVTKAANGRAIPQAA